MNELTLLTEGTQETPEVKNEGKLLIKDLRSQTRIKRENLLERAHKLY